MGLPRQEYGSGLPCHPPGDLLNSGIKTASLMSPTLGCKFFTTSTTWEDRRVLQNCKNIYTFLLFKPLCLDILFWHPEKIKIPHKLTRLRMRGLLSKMGREEKKSPGVWVATLDNGTNFHYLFHIMWQKHTPSCGLSTVHQILSCYSQRCSWVMQVDTTWGVLGPFGHICIYLWSKWKTSSSKHLYSPHEPPQIQTCEWWSGRRAGGQTRVGKDHPEVLVTVGGTAVTSQLWPV